MNFYQTEGLYMYFVLIRQAPGFNYYCSLCIILKIIMVEKS